MTRELVEVQRDLPGCCQILEGFSLERHDSFSMKIQPLMMLVEIILASSNLKKCPFTQNIVKACLLSNVQTVFL